MRIAVRHAVRWHRLIGLSAATLLYASAFPVTAGATLRQSASTAEQSVEFVVAVCDSPGAVQGNYEADVKPLDGVDPLAFAEPWLPENGTPVSGRIPSGCEPGGPGFVLEVARDTAHDTGRIGLVTGIDGRAIGPLTALPHSDRLAAGNEIWARPINADASRYQAIAFRCGNDARNGDLNEYISGTHPDVQHCVAYYVRRPAPTAAAPRTTAPPAVAPTTVAPTTVGVSPPTVAAAPDTTAASGSSPATTRVPAATVPTTSAAAPTTNPGGTAATAGAPTTSSVRAPVEPTDDSSSAGGSSGVESGLSQTPRSIDGQPASGTDTGSAISRVDPGEQTTSTTATRTTTSGDGSASGVTTQRVPAASTTDARPTAPSAPSTNAGGTPSTAGSAAADPDTQTLTSAVPVTRPGSSPATIDRTDAAGSDTTTGDTTSGDGTTSLSRPQPANEQGTGDTADVADATDVEIALGAPGSRGVDLTLAIEVRGLTRPSGTAEGSPWTDTVRAEVICDGGPPKTLSLEPGEDSGFRLSLGMQLPVQDTVSCTHRLIEDGLDDGSFGGVIASVDGQKTKRGEVQTLVLRSDDAARTLKYELIFVDANEANELTASGSTDLSRVGSGATEKTGLGADLPGGRAPGRTGERIPAPTLVALGMMFIVGLALSISQSSKAA